MGWISAVLILLSGIVFGALGIVILKNPHLDWSIALIANGALSVACATFVLTALSSAFSTLFSWRSDRRQEREAELKMQQMELQIRELQAKLETGKPQQVAG